MYLEREIAISKDLIEARYANFFRVGHNLAEFVIEFGQLYSDSEVEVLHTRIVTTPAYARLLLTLLGDSIARYERVHKDSRSESQ